MLLIANAFLIALLMMTDITIMQLSIYLISNAFYVIFWLQTVANAKIQTIVQNALMDLT